MSKTIKSGSGSMLLLAGLGIGAFMLFKSKGDAQGRPADSPAPTGEGGAEIPDAPSIVAVNKGASESPLPTGIVSDEEGMEAVASTPPQSNSITTTGSDADGEPAANAIPPLVSTRLTQKEQTIINQGVLSDDLAIRRPDLYRAIYIRKHGNKGNGRQALVAANAAIIQIKKKRSVSPTQSPQTKRRKMTIQLHPGAGSMTRTAMNLGKRGAAGSQPSAGLLAQSQSTTTQQQSRKKGKSGTPTRKPVVHSPTRRKPVVRKKH